MSSLIGNLLNPESALHRMPVLNVAVLFRAWILTYTEHYMLKTHQQFFSAYVTQLSKNINYSPWSHFLRAFTFSPWKEHVLSVKLEALMLLAKTECNIHVALPEFDDALLEDVRKHLKICRVDDDDSNCTVTGTIYVHSLRKCVIKSQGNLIWFDSELSVESNQLCAQLQVELHRLHTSPLGSPPVSRKRARAETPLVVEITSDSHTKPTTDSCFDPAVATVCLLLLTSNAGPEGEAEGIRDAGPEGVPEGEAEGVPEGIRDAGPEGGPEGEPEEVATARTKCTAVGMHLKSTDDGRLWESWTAMGLSCIDCHGDTYLQLSHVSEKTPFDLVLTGCPVSPVHDLVFSSASQKCDPKLLCGVFAGSVFFWKVPSCDDVVDNARTKLPHDAVYRSPTVNTLFHRAASAAESQFVLTTESLFCKNANEAMIQFNAATQQICNTYVCNNLHQTQINASVYVSCAAFLQRDRRPLAFAGFSNGTAAAWDNRASSQPVWTLNMQQWFSVDRACCSRSSQTFALQLSNGTVVGYDSRKLQENNPVFCLHTNHQPVAHAASTTAVHMSMVVDRNGIHRVATLDHCGTSGVLRTWDMNSFELSAPFSLTMPNFKPLQMAFGANQLAVVAGLPTC